MGEQFDIYFSASGTYKQVIEIVDANYTPQMVVEGLNKNTLFTTMWHGVTAPLEVCDYAGRTVFFDFKLTYNHAHLFLICASITPLFL